MPLGNGDGALTRAIQFFFIRVRTKHRDLTRSIFLFRLPVKEEKQQKAAAAESERWLRKEIIWKSYRRLGWLSIT